MRELAADYLEQHAIPKKRARSGWSDIDLNRSVWIKPSHHTKQKRTEHIPLSGPTLSLLSEMREIADPTEGNLFPGNASGRPLQDIKKFWKGVTARAGIADYRLHDNRHTHASHLVSSGLSLEIVGRLLGHTNPTTTKRYAHIADSPLRAASETFGAKVEMLHKRREAEISQLSLDDSGMSKATMRDQKTR
jgi:integrase